MHFRGAFMLIRVAGAVALSLSLSSFSSSAFAGGGQSGIVHRMSCHLVRYYVAKYSEAAAETWARSHGATDAEIEAARRCLSDAPATQTTEAHWFSR
jgi:hypothetical protein